MESKYPASTPLNTGHSVDDDDDMELREMVQIIATVGFVKAMRRRGEREEEDNWRVRGIRLRPGICISKVTHTHWPRAALVGGGEH